ncbi:hypothetical protein [Myroides odoratus]|uniref:Lipoprotein n=1 Tax=Myroides odoratus TaxID=256 RepID=A0A9Q6Z4D0_MYROD|nr:hypothetical protein [Myroides odoratus]EHQ44034.1 hypothetical protein Myrod_3221 [Myroides odoratus DSM 2801]EKB05318.1 hypothetical protein HMPREF9716_02872 [Myroides odoratus CIP 103059]QQU01329.1 hypothetical protein I6I88_06180 [Myroides odoratus]WQD56407.1 hypothetical protein U0010_12835 [Myroides odoratus]STZ31316.1 Uncharacterised protein [Myroides odoratus]
MRINLVIIIILFSILYACDSQEDRMFVENNTSDTIFFEIREQDQSIIFPRREIKPMSQENVIKLSSWESVYDNLKSDAVLYVYISKQRDQDSMVYYRGYSYNQLNLKHWLVKFPEDDFSKTAILK